MLSICEFNETLFTESRTLLACLLDFSIHTLHLYRTIFVKFYISALHMFLGLKIFANISAGKAVLFLWTQIKLYLRMYCETLTF